MARYKAIIEYDGTDFAGYQRQAEGRTVQGELETALGRIGWMGRTTLAAGRTDTGVHAAGQVIAFELDWKHGDDDLLRALNANLPADVAAQSLIGCSPDFHPRYSAKGRRYRYTIYQALVRSPLARRFAWHVAPPLLNLAAMQAASARLTGRHDFATFGADPEGGESTVRTVARAQWSAQAEWLHFEIQADAFLYRMVRGLVGALKRVGAGDLTLEAFDAIFRSGDRAQCPPVAPPQGLCLVEVLY